MGKPASTSSTPKSIDYASKPLTLLKDAVVTAISLVNRGANNKRFFLFKSADAEADVHGYYLSEGGDLSSDEVNKEMPLIKAGPPEDVWKAVYCVVAVPGEVDSQNDVWDEDGIRKAAHDYLKKSRLINYMHEDLDSVGDLVESAIAPTDLRVGNEVIPKGSWFIAIEPKPELKKQIEDGKITGVSVQGSSKREPINNTMYIPGNSVTKAGYERAIPPRTTTQVRPVPRPKDDMQVPIGSEGPGVINLQHILGLPESGVFDEDTRSAVIDWMKSQGVPGSPTLATIQLILSTDGAGNTVIENETSEPTLDEHPVVKVLKAKGDIFHDKNDKSKTPLWITSMDGEDPVVEYPPNEAGEVKTATIKAKCLKKCGNPETHYEQLVKFQSDNPFFSEAETDYNPATDNSVVMVMDESTDGTNSWDLGNRSNDVDRNSAQHDLKAVLLRALGEGNEFLAAHLSSEYNIKSASDLKSHQFSQDELWGLVEYFVLGRQEANMSESAELQPLVRKRGPFAQGGQSMQKKVEVKVGDFISYGNGQVAEVSEVSGETVSVIRVNQAGKEITKKISIDDLTVLSLTKSSLGGSMGGHSPKAKGKIRYIIRSFGKWAGGKQSIAAKRLLAEHPEIVGGSPERANALAAWLKDQWLGTTKWRGKRKDLKKMCFDGKMRADVKAELDDKHLEKLYHDLSKELGDGHCGCDNLIVKVSDVRDSIVSLLSNVELPTDERLAALEDLLISSSSLSTNLEKAHNMDKEPKNLKGATVEDADGNRWIVIGHNGEELTVVAGKKRAKLAVEDITVVSQGLAKTDCDDCDGDCEKPCENKEDTDDENVEEDVEKSSTTLTPEHIQRLEEVKNFLDTLTPKASEDIEENVEADEAEAEESDEAPEGAEEVEASDESDEVEKADTPEDNNVDATTEVSMGENQETLTLSEIGDAIAGLWEAIDSIDTRTLSLDASTIGDKLDHVADLAKSLDVSERVAELEGSIAKIAESLVVITESLEKSEKLEKRLTALEQTPGASTAAPVDRASEEVIQKSAPEQPLFLRNGKSIL